MKTYIHVALCALFAMPVAHAENKFLQGMRRTQRDAPPPTAVADGQTTGPAPVITALPEIAAPATVAAPRNCSPDNQKSVPLAFLNSMVGVRNGSFTPNYDVGSGTLKLEASDVVSNCQRMVRFELSTPTSAIPEYVVRARIEDCGAATCQYPVSKIVNGQVVEDTVTVSPNFNGLLQCLQQTGALNSDGSANEASIVRQNFEQVWNNVRPSGRSPLVFAAQEALANSADRIPAQYGTIRSVADCYVLERFSAAGESVYSQAAAEEESLNRQAALVCQSGDRDQMVDFVSRYGQNSVMGQVVARALRDSILRDVRGLADKIRSGNGLRDADMSVLREFQNRVIEPLVNKITDLHARISRLGSGDAQRRRLQQELDELSRELASYNRAPYLVENDLDKLERAGRFDESETAFGIILSVRNFSRVGAGDSGSRISPTVAADNVSDGRANYSNELRPQRLDWGVRTGRITGQSQKYTRWAQELEQDITARAAAMPQQIASQYQRMQNVCPRMILQQSIQQCIQAAQQCILRLQRQQQEWDAADRQSIINLRNRAAHFAALEAEGVPGDSDDRGPASEDDQQVARSEAPQRNPTRGQVDDPTTSNYQFQTQGQGQTPQGGWYGQQVPAQGQMIPGMGQQQMPGMMGQQQGGWYGQSGQMQMPGMMGQNGMMMGQTNPMMMGQNMGWGSTFNYQGMQGMQQPWLQQPGMMMGYQQNGFFGQPGMTNFSNPLQGSFFGAQQSPYQGWGQYQSTPFMGQTMPFMNPQMQNFGVPATGMMGTGWYN